MRNLLLLAACSIIWPGWAAAAETVSAASPRQPSFVARGEYATGYGTQQAAVADVNNDGIPDILAANSGAFYVLYGNGNGTFRAGPQFECAVEFSADFVPADLTGSGTMDLVVAGEEYSGPWGVGVCLGNGNGTFQPLTFYQAGTDVDLAGAVVGDFNGDGIPDVAAVGEAGVWLFTGAGGGVLNPGVLIPFPGSGQGFPWMASADFSNDGNLDLAVTTTTGFVVLLGNGNGTFQPAETFTTPAEAVWIVTADINVDKNADIAVMTNTFQILQYFGNGAGGFSKPKPIDNVPGGYFTFADVNGDGIQDLITDYVYVALGKGNGTFASPTYYPIQAGLGRPSVVAADLRNDGRYDIVADTDEVVVSVLLNKGNGKYQDGEWVPVTDGAGCGVTANFSGGSTPDLAVTTGSGISLLLPTGNSASPFTAGTSILISGVGGMGCPVTGDLNNDGVPDLLVPTLDNSVVAYLDNGDGTFTESSTTAVNAAGVIALGDFNNDGVLDFVSTGNLMALGNGDGTFQTPTTVVADPPEEGFTYVTVGDLNGDGWDDIVFTSFFDNEIYILLNDQHGGFTQTVIQSKNLAQWDEPSQAILTSLVSGGALDLVVSCTNAVVVFSNNGQGAFTLNQVLRTGGNLAVADINGDGIPDLIAGAPVGSLAIFLGLGSGKFDSTPIYFGVGPEEAGTLTMNLHGQSPTAGLPDLVVPDLSGGITVLINTTK